MNRFSCFYRLVKPTVVSSSIRDGRILKPYHTVPSAALDEELKHINALSDDDESGSESFNFSLVKTNVVRGCLSDNYWVNKEASNIQILGSGMILLKNFVSFIGQVDMVNICQDFCVPGAFKVPTNRYGCKLRVHMMSLGRNWDPGTGYTNPCRRDGSEPPRLPFGFVRLAQTAIESAQDHFDDDHHLPSMTPDTCIVNFYTSGGRLGLHQDCDESSDSLRRGLPVVSISIGDPAEFWYGHIRDEDKLSKILLESGDVLIFGGKSRLIFHGINKIDLGRAPEPLRHATMMRLGRLNLTLKQV
ncbi:hypothetical protein SSX86_020370 [Deinandra increscens subsp. villosa]|uniref:Fe2OG dioxygenase domain-containing protein n=1 Tax=Deinandra increscens subsp. villosa TaxID=3103831 RepID=A0AAP0CMU2_9ASTR